MTSTARQATSAYDDAAEQRHVRLRQDFLIDPDVVFLNHGSFGACPKPVFERYQTWQAELERQPVEFLGRRLRGLLRDARAALASYLHVGVDDVVYVSNVTEALNIAARSLPLEAGDEILTSNHEYGALERAWTFVSEHRGTRVVPISLPDFLDDPSEIVELIWSGVTPRTRVLFLSHITSPTAVRLPVEPLVKRAREAGVWTVIDGAHAPGQIDLDLAEMGVDFYGGNCHKWLSAPKGAGLLYVRPEMQALIEPLVVSWGWRPRDPGSSVFIDEIERQGTRDPAAALSVPDAIAYQATHDWPAVRAECHELVREFRAGMTEITGLGSPTADTTQWFAQMATMPLPACDTDALKARLYDEFRIEIPLTHWGQGPAIRVSVQGYNTRADVDRALDAIGTLLPQVRTS